MSIHRPIFLALLLIGCGEIPADPVPFLTTTPTYHDYGSYRQGMRDVPRLQVWPDGRFDAIVDGAIYCPWIGNCCRNNPTRNEFYAVWTGVGATLTDTLSANLLYTSLSDTIGVDNPQFIATWSDSGWTLICSLTLTCGQPQEVGWYSFLKLVDPERLHIIKKGKQYE